MSSILRFLPLVVIAGCAAPRAPAPANAPPKSPAAPATTQSTTPLGAAPDGVRLPAGAEPMAYRVAIEADPGQTTFKGKVAIDVHLPAVTHPLWLNAKHLTIARARLRRGGGAPEELRVVDGPDGVIGLAAAAPIPPGEVTVEIEYAGVQIAEQSTGVLRREERGDWYLITDLEPLGARRVVPCFDEPGFKTPWQLELTTPAGLVASSNTPIEREETLADGRRRVVFAETPPLPSYLFAYAVGPFDVVDAGKTRGGVPMRILAPRGRAADAAFMAKQSAPLVAALEDYTGIRFPYAKLDHVAIPGGRGGAMENAGMITYAARLLVIPDSETAVMRSSGVATMAHEVAHQWFGDLVTTAWWDDLWLNEAFATWAADRVMAELHPDLGGRFDHATTRRYALLGEADPSARAIRQPIVEKVDIGRAFDLITYQKGATVLHMFEEAIGPDRFRAGVRAYLEAHRDGSATAADLVAALGTAAGRDLTAALTPWLDQPGAPVVSMSLSCPKGGPAALELGQHRYRAGAAAAAAPDETTWHVPVCVRVRGERKPRCTDLTGATGRIELGRRCPRLVIPSGTGNYFVAPAPAMRASLLAGWKRLTPAEQAALAGDTVALADAGLVDAAAVLDLLPRLGASADPNLIRTARLALTSFEPAVAERDRAALARLVRDSLGKLARRATWLPRAGEDHAIAAARLHAMVVVADLGDDPEIKAQTSALARRWLDDHGAVPATIAGYLLDSAIRADDGTLFDLMLSRLPTETDATARRTIAGALAETRDPARLVRGYEQVTAQAPVRVEDIAIFFAAEHPATAAARLGWLRDHLAEVLPKIPEDWRPSLAPSTCDPALRAEVATLLERHFVPLPAFGASSRDRTLATIDQCLALRAAHAPALATYFSTR